MVLKYFKNNILRLNPLRIIGIKFKKVSVKQEDNKDGNTVLIRFNKLFRLFIVWDFSVDY